MKRIFIYIKLSAIYLMVITTLCGVIYPGIVTGIAQLAFHNKANGSMIEITLKDGSVKEMGSELIAQEFSKPQYLIGRVTEVSNLSPVGEKQQQLVQERIDWWRRFDPENTADIPQDILTASGSGVDPNISPAAAEYQIKRIAKARGIGEQAVLSLVKKYTTGRFLGFWGEPSVNVLKVNLALDGLY